MVDQSQGRNHKAHKLVGIKTFFGIVLVMAAVLAFSGPAFAGLQKASSVDVITNISYLEGKQFDKNKHVLDLYVPKGVENPPVMCFFHGGAWSVGDKADTSHIGSYFAEHGVMVVNINYRLSPDVMYPAFMEDAAQAVVWTMSNAGQYGGNTGALFLGGHSSGAHIAALLATNERFLGEHNLSTSIISGVLAVSGAFKIEKGFYPRVFHDQDDKRADASPVMHIDDKTPPFLILFGTLDMVDVIDQSKSMAKVLKEKKIKFRMVEVTERNHGNIALKIGESTDRTTKEMLRFLSKYSK